MGDWRTVQIVGTCAASEVEALRKAIDPGADYENHHCLNGSDRSIAGLRNWGAEKINAHGNLAERNYDPDDVARQLEKLAIVAPSLAVKVHCGGNYEDKTCVATVILQDGKAVIGSPEVKRIAEFAEDDLERRVLQALLNARRL